MLSPDENRTVQQWIAQRQAGYSLPRQFYTEELIYRADIERLWRRGWLFAGHSCQIPDAGDYFTMELDSDSLIVVRQDDGSLGSFHNLCRHRGTLLCHETEGKVTRFTCPYHQWTYARDGRLLSCRGMQEDLDKDPLSLHSVAVRELAGMVFVSLDSDPPDFAAAAKHITPLASPQGMRQAKVAKIVDYDVAANWKLVWENNRECYHCNVNHPQYIKANFDHYNADDTSDRIQARIDQAAARSEQKWAAAGLAATHKTTGMAPFPDADRNLWYAANRTALVDGYVSETMDGQQVAPLMGEYPDADVGTLRIRTMPNFWNHSSCDHAVSTRLLPRGINRTQVRVIWLVAQDAVEGTDYELADVMPFWQLTSEQDWELCEWAQRGVSSSHYTPGPYSTYKEYNVDGFVRWYLAQLAE